MLCWNCGKEIPDTAKYCSHCEVKTEDAPTVEETQLAQELISEMDSETLSEFGAIFDQSKDADDFINRIMIGDCLRCGSSNTGDCGNDPDIENPIVGRCFDCGGLWCPFCGEIFATPAQARSTTARS